MTKHNPSMLHENEQILSKPERVSRVTAIPFKAQLYLGKLQTLIAKGQE